MSAPQPGQPNLMGLVPSSAKSTQRLRLDTVESPYGWLDGVWWPRSTDPQHELPGLVMELDAAFDQVVKLILGADGWSVHMESIAVADRTIPLDFFASQPGSLLTVVGTGGGRIHLLVLAPDTLPGAADAAMALMALTGNPLTAEAGRRTDHPSGPELLVDLWENEGGHVEPSTTGMRQTSQGESS